MLRFIDTRTGQISEKPFSEVVLQGLAESGGLFVPETLPHLSDNQLRELSELSYAEAAARVFSQMGIDFCDEEIAAITTLAYGENFDDPEITPLAKIKDGVYSLELWHGPTSAFKDMALQCMPLFFSSALRREREKGGEEREVLILVATSGDTGKAALAGFAGRENIKICVLFPDQGVSAVQRLQMTTQEGEGVEVLGVNGNFDDCQNIVKELFTDDVFKQQLKEAKGLELSSANSINFGRLMPQIVYYLVAPMRLKARGELLESEVIDVVVPTGNFGNILAAYYAKIMGAPIGRLICASNTNNVLSDFINTGIYDISDREFFETPSPSMDILISSNLERFLYHLAGSENTSRWMCELRENARFQVDEETLRYLQIEMAADYATNEESLANIKHVFDEYGYLMEPHTSVAELVGSRHRSVNPLMVVSTAHWAKFGSDVLRALCEVGDKESLPAEFEGQSEFELLREVARRAPQSSPIPERISLLEHAEPRFKDVIDSKAQALRDFLLS